MNAELNHLPEDRELSFYEKCIPFINDHFPEQFLRNSAFIVAAVATAIFGSTLAYVFAIAASSQFLAISLLNVYMEYDRDAANLLQRETLYFQKNHPRLQLIAFLVTVAVFFIFPLVSGLLGGLLGLYIGLLSDSTYYKRKQSTPDGL